MPEGQHATPEAPAIPAVPPVPAVPTASKEGESNHSAPQTQETTQHATAQTEQFMFTVNGDSVSDFSAVQQHITNLETFRAETIESARVEFVNGLAKENKILATQVDSTVEFAKSLTDAQFEQWKATQESAPAQPVLGQYGQGSEFTQGQEVTEESEKDGQIANLKAIVNQHKRSGMKPERIKELDSYSKLVALDPNYTL